MRQREVRGTEITERYSFGRGGRDRQAEKTKRQDEEL